MSFTGDVNLTIADGGATAIAVPAARLQVVMGCCESGTAYAIVATRQPATILSTFGYGPMSEAAGLAIQSGATVLAMRIPTTTAGTVVKKSAKVVSTVTNANPAVVTTTASHGLISGDVVVIASVVGSTGVNATWIVTVLSSTTFSVPVAAGGAYVSGGTVTPAGVIQSGADTSIATLAGTAKDDYYGLITVSRGGTVGTDSIQVTVDLGGGRSVSLPRVTIGTALTYVIPQTGLTLTLGAGALTAGTTFRFRTTGPQWAVADVVTALSTLQSSMYAASGWGSMHLVGLIGGTDAGTVATSLTTMATAKVYTRLMGHVRDATPPAAWGGTAETDAVWSAAVNLDFASTTSTRFGVAAGYYNVRSVFPNPVAGLPIYRRPLSFAWAARVAGQLPAPADLEAWVRLGAVSQIVQDMVNDPLDGFVYHDEQAAFVFDNLNGGPGRMTAARLRNNGLTGWWISNGETLSTTDYQIMARGRVMDLASGLVVGAAQPYIAQRVKLNPNGTIREIDALKIEGAQTRAIDNAIGDQISGRTIVVDRDWNIGTNNSLKVTGTIQGDGYVLEINETIGFGSIA